MLARLRERFEGKIPITGKVLENDELVGKTEDTDLGHLVDVVEKSLSELLSPQEIATMNAWISKYGEINIDASDPKGVADAMSVKLTMYGTGAQQQMTQPSQQLLLNFIQDLNQKLMGQ